MNAVDKLIAIQLPRSKSMINRVLLLAALAHGKTTIVGITPSDDVLYMLQALKLLKINYDHQQEQSVCNVFGIGNDWPTTDLVQIFLGNAGSALRPLVAVLCLFHGNEYIVTGDLDMQRRPIKPLVDALRQGGAKIDYLQNIGYPPLHIRGGFHGGVLTVDCQLSSQYLTALLIATPLASYDSSILVKKKLVSEPYVAMTLYLMRCFGVVIEHENYRVFHVKGRQRYKAQKQFLIEADATSASYFLAASLITRKPVRITGISRHSVQAEVTFASVLKQMGAPIFWSGHCLECCPSKMGILRGIDIDMNAQPDSAMTLALIALFAHGSTTIRNIYHWRFKECDRLHAMVQGLRSVGAVVDFGDDWICIQPPSQLKDAYINTYRDHRMAMCFSLLNLSQVKITFSDTTCVKKSFPTYFEQLALMV